MQLPYQGRLMLAREEVGSARTLPHHPEQTFADEDYAEAVEKDVEQREVSEEDRAVHEDADGDQDNTCDDVLHGVPPGGVNVKAVRGVWDNPGIIAVTDITVFYGNNNVIKQYNMKVSYISF